MKTTVFNNVKMASPENTKEVYVIQQVPNTEPKEFKEPEGIKSDAVVYTIGRN